MAVQIPCPECGAVLKLPDRSLLGRKGKCPKCNHRFVLTEPDEVELELVPASIEEPLVPAKVRRVHEESPSISPAPAATTPEAFPSIDVAAVNTPTPGTDRLKRRRPRGQRTEVIVGGVIAVFLAAAIAGGVVYLQSQPAPSISGQNQTPVQNADYETERNQSKQLATLIAADRPTQGDPITLQYIPAGASIVIHLRPAELWATGSPGEELRFCLGERFSTWLVEQFELYCLLPPAEIEEATFAVSLGARGSEPVVSSVVRPLTPLKTSELIQRFDGSPQSFGGIDVFVGTERAYVMGRELDNEKRPILFATASADNAQSLAESVITPSITSDDIEQLLVQTDRQRHFTVVFRPSDLRTHYETLAADDLQSGWNTVLDQLGDGIEAAVWSGHIGKQNLDLEFLVRNIPAVTPTQLAAQLRNQLDRTPKQLVAAIERMQPSHVGDRKLIGRFPAMAHLFALATVEGVDTRLVMFQTRLPERAGPNLALAGLLTWYEAARTDFDMPAVPTSSEQPAGPIAERLKLPIDIDFRRTPLEEAFAYIGNETKVTFVIDGDALKMAAYTRNMPQVMDLGKVPAEKAVAKILSAYDKMAVVIDDASQQAIVTTKSAAAEKGLTPASFPTD